MSADESPAIDLAQKEFVRLGAQQYFSAPLANRYFIQKLDGARAALVLGSIGAVSFEEGEPAVPIAHVERVVIVDRTMLIAMRDTIDNLFGEERDA